MFENIDRIPVPSADAFVKEYVRKHKPVILTNLFPAGPIERAVRELGTKEIQIQDEYMATLKKQLRDLAAGKPLALPKETTTVRDYLDASAGGSRMCIEQPISPSLDGLLPIPAICDGDDLEGRFFVGKAGNVAHLHFDSDQRQVIQLHLFGSKEVILFPPSASAELSPFRNFSSWHLERLSEAERDELVRKLGGYQCRLRAGESLFMPALIWHYLYYESPGISLSLRFGRNAFNKYLGSRCHASHHLQSLGWSLVDETNIAPASRKAFDEIVEAMTVEYASPYEKGRALEDLFRKLNPSAPARISWLDELGVVDRLREWEIDGKQLYREPAAKPLFFRLDRDEDRRKLDALKEREPGLLLCDTLTAQLRDLIATRKPARKLSPVELDALVKAHLNGKDTERYGVWVYYPWSRHLVHCLDEAEFVELRTNRNKNKITLDEQKRLAEKKIGVVGLSVGYASVMALALERGCGELRIADFDTLDLSNLNRIPGAIKSLGLPKTVIAARAVAELDPFLKVTCFHDGIRPDNLDKFLFDGGKLDLLVDLCDSIDIKVRLRYAGKAHRIPVLMETSDRGLIDIERHDLDPDYKIFHGMAGDPDPDQLQRLSPEEKIPFILKIAGNETLSPRIKASLTEIGRTLKTWPQLGSAIFHGGGAVADTARRILLGEITESGRFFVDFEELVAPEREPLRLVKGSRPAKKAA